MIQPKQNIAPFHVALQAPYRYSIATVRPSLQPRVRGRCTNVAILGCEPETAPSEKADGREFANGLLPLRLRTAYYYHTVAQERRCAYSKNRALMSQLG